MVFKEIVSLQTNILNQWEDIKDIEEVLKDILETFKASEERLYKRIFSITDANQLVRDNVYIYQNINDLKTSLSNKNVNSFKYILAIQKFENSCKKINEKHIFSDNLDDMINELYKFFEILNEFYISSRSPKLLEDLINSARSSLNLIFTLESQFSYIKKIDAILESNKEYQENEVLEINILNNLTYKEIVALLIIIMDMYEMLRSVLKVEEDIEIIKIESGSFYEKIKGNKIIIKILTHALIIIGTQMCENYMNPNNKKIDIETFKEMYDLKKTLEKDGYDVAAIESELQSIYGKIFKGSKMIINSSSRFRINNIDFNFEGKEQIKLKWNPKYLEYIEIDEE